MTELRSAYDLLVSELHRHNHAYYVDAQPTVSDGEYDRQFQRLLEIEQLHPEWRNSSSPSQRVGSALAAGSDFEKVEHAVPMISIESLFANASIVEFEERVRKDLALETEIQPTFICEPKWDGVSASLIYEKGVLVRGVSRGDGKFGEDLTANLRAVGGVPLRLFGANVPDLLEVRGEVMMSIAGFDAMNNTLRAQGEQVFANPRNVVAGTLKRLDPAVVATRPLRFMCYSVVRMVGQEMFATHGAAMVGAKGWGFAVSSYSAIVEDAKGMIKFHDDIESRRDEVEYEMDGVVYKVDSQALCELLGSRARTPRWVCAHKFAPREETTKLVDILIQVGRTGRLTPRAVLEPVSIGGVTVQYATLHHASYIADLDIRLGDQVLVRRAGDVIPQIVGPVVAVRDGSEQVFEFPLACPECDAKIESDGEHSFCVNIDCPAQLIRRVQYMVSRVALDIDGIGEKAVVQLHAAKLLESVEQLFNLDYSAIEQLEGWGEKSVTALRNGILATLHPKLAKFLSSLGISNVGPETSRAICEKFNSIDALLALADVDEADAITQLSEIEGVGEKVARSLLQFIGSDKNIKAVRAMLSYGLQPQVVVVSDTGHKEAVIDKVFVLTGSLSCSRPEMGALIQEAGGKVTNTVSKNTDYLVAGDKAGSKLTKAQDLGVEVLDEAQVRKLLA
ncbi:MAG: DNA ligase (NAD+) [Myxococcota bacterium]|jgi:DNA ligase (NAD+)